MSTNGFTCCARSVTDVEQDFHRNWACFLALGITLIIVGAIAIGYPVLATLATVTVVGVLLLIGAGVEVAGAFWASRWGGFFLHVFAGLLYLFVGAVILERPGLGAAGYTLLLAMFFVAAGLVRVVFAITHRFSGWGWALLSGAVSLILGIMIWREWPVSALWVIGTFVGIEMFFNGVSWVMLGMAARHVSIPAASREAVPVQPVGV